jgi:hypothetical protein
MSPELGPLSSVSVAHHFGSDGTKSGNSRRMLKPTRMTHNVTLLPPIAAVQKDYSITSSARSWIAVDMSTPIALAVLRLMTNSNFEAC